jgi:hypothetical protein
VAVGAGVAVGAAVGAGVAVGFGVGVGVGFAAKLKETVAAIATRQSKRVDN